MENETAKSFYVSDKERALDSRLAIIRAVGKGRWAFETVDHQCETDDAIPAKNCAQPRNFTLLL